MTDVKPLYTVALVERGGNAMREATQPATGRLHAIGKALERRGLSPEPALYDEENSGAFEQRLLEMDAVLVWVNPVDAGRTRQGLDDILRRVAAAGVFVSAHPDVIAKIGVKAVLHWTRTLGWGTDTHIFETPTALTEGLPKLLAHGPRVLKHNRGNGGLGVWKVESAGGGRVRAQEAQGEPVVHVLPLDTFIEQRREAFSAGGSLIDQPYQSRLTEGMIRCYVSGQRVVGFGHQLVRALAPPEAGPGGRRLYSGPGDPRFQKLSAALEREWIPQMAELLSLRLDALPVIWDADFLLGSKTPSGEDSYVLCEINASSVFPIPDEAPDGIAATLIAHLSASERND
jgi:glutathione synthase/RimK-type ligase-like ATP-grasp enzyme